MLKVKKIVRYLARYRRLEKINGKQTWKQFDKVLVHKKLILFCSGNVCQYFCEEYGNRYSAECVFDNDASKQGNLMSGLYICKPEMCKAVDDKKDAVVLICSIKEISKIYNQLSEMGYQYIFSLAHMEAKRPSCIMQRIPYAVYLYIKESPMRMLRKYTHWTQEDIRCRRMYLRCLKYPVQRDKILFCSEGRYKDHEKYISDKLLESGVACEIVWMIKQGEKRPEKVRCVEFEDKEKLVYEFATSKIWFDSESLPLYIRKRRGQLLIKTKHWSSITLKKFYYDTPVYYKTMPHIDQKWKHNTKMTDYILVGSEFDKRTCRSGYRYQGEFLEFGSPRTDILFTPDKYRKEVKEYYHISQNTKIVMYAPTFRLGRGTTDCNVAKYSMQMPDFSVLRQSLEERFGGKWQVLLRLHPLVENREGVAKEACVDASAYDDVQELLAAADMVITDYSSLMFEPAMVGKMVLLYAPDVEDYCANERGLWFDLAELPFPLAKDDFELQGLIQNFDEEIYMENVRIFFDKHGVHEDGHACERTVEFIKEVISNFNIKE